MWNALRKIPGLRFPKEGASGDASGVYWAPTSRYAANQRRSFARTGHYDGEEGPSSRSNFHLLPGHRVTQIMLSKPDNSNEADMWTADGISYVPRDGDLPESAWEVRARKEIVIAAGTPHTPQVLQRSGIGPRPVLEAAGVDVKVELPGVGENFQDHINLGITYNCKFTFTQTSFL